MIIPGSSLTRSDAFVLKKDNTSDVVVPKMKVNTEILLVGELKKNQLKELRKLQGKAAVCYLKLRYGSPDT